VDYYLGSQEVGHPLVGHPLVELGEVGHPLVELGEAELGEVGHPLAGQVAVAGWTGADGDGRGGGGGVGGHKNNCTRGKFQKYKHRALIIKF
jgi:hypothetical protein